MKLKEKFKFELSAELKPQDELGEDTVYTVEHMGNGTYKISWPMEKHIEQLKKEPPDFAEWAKDQNFVDYPAYFIGQAISKGDWVVLD